VFAGAVIEAIFALRPAITSHLAPRLATLLVATLALFATLIVGLTFAVRLADLRGPRGHPGAHGAHGLPGATGGTGQNGPRGGHGPRGERGLRGRRGVQGERGPQGAPGSPAPVPGS
jgi:hypothetical protein